MNRIKEARNLRKISQNDLAVELQLTQQAISYYEQEKRFPDKHTWEKIAHFLQVPVEYLQGKTDDPDGWDLWASATGFTTEQIKQEIVRMKEAKHIIGKESDLQNLIGQAVMNLDGMGNTDRGIINDIAHSIINLQSKLRDKYEDPQKTKNFETESGSKIFPASTPLSDLIYDDLSAEAYQQAMDILITARRDLQNISNNLQLK
ncbi:helix-turn-helix domain-containing protein [Enterococcus pingfangensis]|uniref:helix-turn-helix domain-containing protein n=1 Tax=Enterococcus pingfangensis TaxID=2559924 RepID=UPI0010F80475|nr:helix-turn-helix transcriptional regulator [Enterococcus pingfangensis]